MKKLLAVIVSISMLLSIGVLLCVPAAAVEGQWEVYATAGEFREDFDPVEDDYHPVPGYSYVEGEGLVVTPADWKDFSPKIGIQTKQKVSLKDGVYMLVRIDDFTYQGDKWFTYSISDTKYVSPGATNTLTEGEMITALMRPDDSGKINGIQWNGAAFKGIGSNTMTYGDDQKYDANGKPLLELVITWENNSYKVVINGTEAPEGVATWLNEKYATDDMAYIGLNIQNSIVGGTAALSVLKFGTSKDTATTPSGDDSREAKNYYLTIAEKTDPSTVPAGQPGLLINASREASDAKGTVTNKPGSMTSITEENYIHYTADRANLEIGLSCKYEKTVDIDDFPVIVVLTKNLCTCGEESVVDCLAFETANMYIMTGETFSANDNEKVQTIDICYNPIIRGEDSYLYFYVDTSDMDLMTWDAQGRFNGARFDIKSIRTDIPGANEFDICFLALFRTLEEAEAYIEDFVGPEIESPDNPDDSETVPEYNTETGDTPDDSETVTPDDSETATPDTPDTPDVPDDETTKAPEKTEAESEKEEAAVGCASSVGFGMLAIIALAGGCGFVAFKKRR